ncbi:MAG: hypothetical protein KGJ41_13625 [Rhodospirillales bacterium]|nr:hypothetical protein [Rhodospirillales bacterium]MDE2200051.1 hypothetical protein [Rhodospirillales bacterium]MDE2576759.1 hypothetical protein [Rhodospirillales bacterium]
MSNTSLTRHAIERMGQRGFRDDDLDLIRLIGTPVEDGYLVLVRDCQAAERDLKRLWERIRHLNGKRLVEKGGCVVTAYRATKTKERQLMRRGSERDRYHR